MCSKLQCLGVSRQMSVKDATSYPFIPRYTFFALAGSSGGSRAGVWPCVRSVHDVWAAKGPWETSSPSGLPVHVFTNRNTRFVMVILSGSLMSKVVALSMTPEVR